MSTSKKIDIGAVVALQRDGTIVQSTPLNQENIVGIVLGPGSEPGTYVVRVNNEHASHDQVFKAGVDGTLCLVCGMPCADPRTVIVRQLCRQCEFLSYIKDSLEKK